MSEWVSSEWEWSMCMEKWERESEIKQRKITWEVDEDGIWLKIYIYVFI